MVAPSVFLAAASASSKDAYLVPLNSATSAPALAASGSAAVAAAAAASA